MALISTAHAFSFTEDFSLTVFMTRSEHTRAHNWLENHDRKNSNRDFLLSSHSSLHCSAM